MSTPTPSGAGPSTKLYVGILLGAALLIVALLLRTRPSDPSRPPAPAARGEGTRADEAPAESPPRTPKAPPSARNAPLIPPGPPPSLQELFVRSEQIFSAVLRRNFDGMPKDVPNPERFATLLPLGYWALLIRAHPDEAFTFYSGVYSDPEKRQTAYWALRELARAGHPAAAGFFNSLLQAGDREQVLDALQALSYCDVPQLPPRLMPYLTMPIRSSKDDDLVREALRSLSSLTETDVAALKSHFPALAEREKEASGVYNLDSVRKKVDLLGSPDRAAAFSAALREGPRSTKDDPQARLKNLESMDLAEWIVDVSVRKKMDGVVPALQERIRREIEHLRAEERADELDVAALEVGGHYDLPGGEAANYLAEVRLIARMRKAVLDLGGTLSAEERAWLDRLRMLRGPREYLVEAGLEPR